MKPNAVTLGSFDAADDDGIAQSQTPGSGGALTLNGALVTDGVATLDKPRRVLITAAGDESGRAFTITGTDRYDRVQTEEVTGPNAGTVNTVHDYKTVTKVEVDAGTAGAVEVGTSAKASTAWIPMDYHRQPFEASVAAILSDDGDLTYDIEHTYFNVLRNGDPDDADEVFSKETGKTDDFETTYEVPVAAVRLTVTSYTAGSVKARILQSGLRGS